MNLVVDVFLGAVLPLFLLICAGYLIKNNRDDNVMKWIRVAVKAAEQIYGSGCGKEKFQYVAEWISAKFSISKEDLKNLIESAVWELNKETNK